MGKLLAPGHGPATTLVVTDVQNSTLLWESLEVTVMDATLALHHSVLRTAAKENRGYESATEGDSFILAFHTTRCVGVLCIVRAVTCCAVMVFVVCLRLCCQPAL